METNAKCAYCGAATQLFAAGVPICAKCNEAHKKVPPPAILNPSQSGRRKKKAQKSEQLP